MALMKRSQKRYIQVYGPHGTPLNTVLVCCYRHSRFAMIFSFGGIILVLTNLRSLRKQELCACLALAVSVSFCQLINQSVTSYHETRNVNTRYVLARDNN
jgi:hypothetical protein